MRETKVRGAARKALSVRGPSSEREPPAKTLETAVVTVRRHPFAAGLNGEWQMSVRYEVSLHSVFAESTKDVPVTRPGLQNHALRLIPQLFGEGERLADRVRLDEHLRMRHDPNESRQDEFRYSVCRVGVDYAFEPVSIGCMVVRVPRCAQTRTSTSNSSTSGFHQISRSDAVSFRSTPGRTPSPRAVLRRTGLHFAPLRRRASVSRSASSRMEVSVQPDSAACFFTSARRRSSRRTVVRMHRTSP